MSLSRRHARIEVGPTHLSYPAWWSLPLSYEALPPLTAVTDCAWIIGLSAVTGLAYHAIVLNERGDLGQLVGAGIAVAALFSTAAHARGLYRTSNLLRVRAAVGQSLLIWVMIFLCLATVVFALKISNMFSRGAVLMFFASGLLAIASSRIGMASLLRRGVSSGLLSCRRVVLLADSSLPSHDEYAKRLEPYGYSLSRVFMISAPEGGESGERVAAHLADALRYIRQRCPDEIMLAIRWHRTALIQRVSHELRCVPVPARLLADSEIDWLLERPLVELGPSKAVELQRAPLNIRQRALKRILDFALASVGLTLLIPLFLLMAFAIRFDSNGPVLFQQSRIGFNGRAFRIYKFRTMTTLEDGERVRQARRNDQRVTRVGRVLRRFSLDELPQLVNVLRGEMSLVGPRPHALIHDDEYSKLIAEYATRHKMKPGITGWAQVNGCRGETPEVDAMKRRVDHDLWYINCWSIWLDIRILAKTLSRVLKDRNAY